MHVNGNIMLACCVYDVCVRLCVCVHLLHTPRECRVCLFVCVCFFCTLAHPTHYFAIVSGAHARDQRYERERVVRVFAGPVQKWNVYNI